MLIVKVESPTTEYDLGTFLSGAQYDTGQVTNQEIKVLCYPSGGGIKITLPPTDILNAGGFAEQNLMITIADASGDGAVNNITVEAGTGLVSVAHEKINGANTMVLSTAYGSGNFEILTTGAWVGGANP